ncbi:MULTISPECIES: hypothetical protein [Clostridium]|uniref:hypothetical protein n=1 Tax=Clostridium TaxID=1485 RepID=UPI0003795248|nr:MULTISPECIES: hypothetical protein [Clostridium]MBN1037094.1 hypothetical protein [Clostridium botulinum]MBY6810158.1 hypothetical protein [Clostridium botulinum]MBY6823486.1 hypothetical protein [Clostridium botulinum]MBY6834018.1 hypothetical protein [Clostridium botulinum]MBY6972365.1 hypothetical protein [Clostridium botulinum]
MAFSFGGLISAVVGAVAKVANAVVNALSPVAKSGGIVGGIAGAAVGVAEAVLGATAEFADVCEDGEIDDEEAEELLEDVFKLLVGAFIFPFDSGSSSAENDDEVFNISDMELEPKYEYKSQPKEAYLAKNEYFNIKTAVLKASAKAEAKGNIFENRKLNPNLRLGIEEEMKMVEFSAETKKFGNKELGVQFDGNVGGLKEKAELGGYFGEHGEHGKFNCYAKGAAIATIFDATANQKLTIFGCEVAIEETGYLGGLGLDVEGGIVESKLKFKIKGSAIIGGGFSISVGAAD